MEDFLRSPAKVFTSTADVVDDCVRGVGRWRFSEPTSEDIEGLGPYFVKLMEEKKVSVLDLNALSLDEYIDNGLEDEDQARVLILRDWAKGADKARVVSRIFFSHLRCSAEFEINSICPGPDIHT